MGVYKEEAHLIEKVAKQQKQIYPDACDFGVPVEDANNDANVKMIQEAINGLSGSLAMDRSFDDYATGKTSVTKVFIPWEQDEGMFCGTLYIITYVHIKPKCRSKIDIDYISVEMKRHMQKENPFILIDEEQDETRNCNNHHECDGCSGNGIYYGAGIVMNGNFQGFTGTCFRCGGKGYQTDEDVKRNTYYDNHKKIIA